MSHEINNPIGFITSNLGTLKTYMARCLDLLQHVAQIMHQADFPEALQNDFNQRWRELKLDLIMADASVLIEESLAGAERITSIVSDLRGISHIDDSATTTVDLNNELNMLLNLLSHETADRVRVVRNFQPLRPITCKPVLLAQALRSSSPPINQPMKYACVYKTMAPGYRTRSSPVSSSPFLRPVRSDRAWGWD